MSRKLVLIFTLSLLFRHFINAQYGQWTWMSGANSWNGGAVHGTQGVPSPLNTPGSFYEGCEWTDKSGNFWLYGGVVNGLSQTSEELWKYDPIIQQWTWVMGTTALSGLPVYGVQGVAAATNHPGGLGYAMLSWVDNAGN